MSTCNSTWPRGSVHIQCCKVADHAGDHRSESDFSWKNLLPGKAAVTPLDLDAISARIAGATPAPWHVYHLEFGSRMIVDGRGYLLGQIDDGQNADFIAAARTDAPALVARVRELENELAKYDVTDEEVRAVVAEYTAKIDAEIEKGKANLVCYWCGEVADVTDAPAVHAHYRTCLKSPLVIENEALRLELASLRRSTGDRAEGM